MKFKLKWTVCRVCLKEGEGLSTIFVEDDNKTLIADKIMECAGITITQDRNLPEEICKKCSAFLSVAHKFRTMCKSSDEILQTFVDKKIDSSFISGQIEEGNIDLIEKIESESDTEQEKVAVHNEIETPILMFDELDPGDTFFNNDESVQSDVQEERNELHSSEAIELFEITEIDEKVFEKKKVLRNMKSRGSKRISTKKVSKTLAMDSDGTPIIKYRNLNSKPSHICEICGNIYKRRHALDNHMRWHRKEKPFDCEICGVAFGLNTQLTRHMRRHTGQKPYECQYCGRKFSDLGTKNKHERIHTGERPFKCETCGKSFSYSHVLNVHLLTHTGEKRYGCDQCGKRFSQPHHLKAHLNTLAHQKPQVSNAANTGSTKILNSLQETSHMNIILKNNEIADAEISNSDGPSAIDLIVSNSNNIILSSDIIQAESPLLDGSNTIHLIFAS